MATIMVLAWASPAQVAPAGSQPGRDAAALSATLAPAAIRQGRVATLTIFASVPVSRLTVRFAGRSWPLYRETNGAWRTILGTDPTTSAGRHTVALEAFTPSGERLVVRRVLSVLRVVFPQRRITFDPARQALLTREAVERERRRVNAALRVLHGEQLWEEPFTQPVAGKVSSPYGVLSIYQGVTRGFHAGTDFPVPEGTPVQAANHGIVRLAEALPLSGNAVFIDHGLGIITSYLHLSAISVRVNQRVTKGDVVGAVGSTGLATGPHLHWGLRVSGIRVDPMPWTAR